MENFELKDSLEEAIISYYSGDLTKEEAQELLIWIDQSPENLKYFQSIGRVWHASGLMSRDDYEPSDALKKVRKKLIERDIRRVPEKTVRIGMSVLYNSAATIFLLALLSIAIFYIIRKPEQETSTLSYFEAFAPKGSRSQMTLSDGTQIWLNAGTALKYNSEYGKTNRDIYLDGEAYFKVSKNENVPFKVTTSEILITALGTAFNVKSYSDEGIIETTLEEGSLKIDPLKPVPESDKSESPVILKPNQKAVFQKTTGTDSEIPATPVEVSVQREQTTSDSNIEKLQPLPVSVTSVPDTRLYTSWKDANWVFKNEKLSTLAPKLERRYDIRIEFSDTTLLNYAFSGTLKEESIEQVLEIIRLSAPIRFIVDSKDVIVQYDESMRKNFKNLITPN